MKRKFMRFAFLFLLTVALCSVTALADGEQGIYIGDQTNVTITPKTAGDAACEQATVEGKTLYKDAVRLDVSVTNAEEGKQYLIVVTSDADLPKADNIVYIDQKAGAADLKFNAYPSALSSGNNYSVWLASSDQGLTSGSPAGTFSYYAAYTLGDIDGVNNITATDALFALQMSVGVGTWTDTQRLAADVDGVNNVTATDSLLILQKSVGLPSF